MPDYAEAEAIEPDEDPDAIYFAAWCATDDWRKKIAPFQGVHVRHVTSDMLDIGRRFTLSLCPPKAPSARKIAIFKALANMREWADDPVDGVASGW